MHFRAIVESGHAFRSSDLDVRSVDSELLASRRNVLGLANIAV
jgi:hypothetical protein